MPRLLNLNVFLTPDEPLFLDHARAFAAGIMSGDFTQTLGIGYPGVTVAALAALPVSAAATEMGAYAAGRAAVVLLTGVLLLVLYRLGRELLGPRPAFWSVVLLALDPYTLAYSRLLHHEMLLALFMSLAGVAYLLWLHQSQRRWLAFTGLFCGLALLTKSTALLLGPMLGLSLLGWAVMAGQVHRPGWWLTQAAAFIGVAGLAAALFAALWPAMWIDPAGALALTFGRLLTDQEAGTGNLGMFWLGRFAQDPGPAFYPVAFLLKSTPWLLAGLFLSLFYLSNSKLRIKNSEFTISLWLLALTYLIIMTIASKKTVRYMLPAFPLFYLLAGQALTQAGHWLKTCGQDFIISKSPPPLREAPLWGRFSAPLPIHFRFTTPVFCGLLFLFTLLYHPYYFTYYNPLVLGWRWAPDTLLVGWGEGLDMAARYVGQQPGGRVAVWYEWLFPLMSGGAVEPVTPPENMLTADYTVLYINQVQRDIPNPNIIHYFRTRRRPEFIARLAGIDYAWVYPGPVVGFDGKSSPAAPLTGDFGGELRLTGYDPPAEFSSGDTALLTLHWQITALPPAERFVFVRLVDAQGRVWAAADGPPLMGLWPADRRQPGMVLEDVQALPILPGTPPGLYRLEIGVYDPATGQPLPASGLPAGPGGGLVVGEITLLWQPSPLIPELSRRPDTRLAHNARLAGYDPPPAVAVSGDVLSIRLAWREARQLRSLWAAPNDEVLFTWQAGGRQAAEQRDPLPLPVEAWGRGASLLSWHGVIVPPALPPDQYDLAVMLHNGTNPAGNSLVLGTVDITAPPHIFDLPAAARPPLGPARLNGDVSLAGYALERAGQQITVQLYWQTDAALITRYKVFTQLLGPANTVVTQSDSFPADGTRPTTGWLPGEIITDAHTLVLPPNAPPGPYRLIAGLYNPATGARLPLLEAAGSPFADAILAAEVGNE